MSMPTLFWIGPVLMCIIFVLVFVSIIYKCWKRQEQNSQNTSYQLNMGTSGAPTAFNQPVQPYPYSVNVPGESYPYTTNTGYLPAPSYPAQSPWFPTYPPEQAFHKNLAYPTYPEAPPSYFSITGPAPPDCISPPNSINPS